MMGLIDLEDMSAGSLKNGMAVMRAPGTMGCPLSIDSGPRDCVVTPPRQHWNLNKFLSDGGEIKKLFVKVNLPAVGETISKLERYPEFSVKDGRRYAFLRGICPPIPRISVHLPQAGLRRRLLPLSCLPKRTITQARMTLGMTVQRNSP
jgi:hypothetical protein